MKGEAPSRSESADDGCEELRGALRAAFPLLVPREVEHLIDLARSLNDYPNRARSA